MSVMKEVLESPIEPDWEKARLSLTPALAQKSLALLISPRRDISAVARYDDDISFQFRQVKLFNMVSRLCLYQSIEPSKSWTVGPCSCTSFPLVQYGATLIRHEERGVDCW